MFSVTSHSPLLPIWLQLNPNNNNSHQIPPHFLSFRISSSSSRVLAVKSSSGDERLPGNDAGYGGSGGGGGGGSSNLLRKPVVQPVVVDAAADSGNGVDDEQFVDWEDKILEDTVPLVGFVRMILQSGKYESGERLSPEHETTIIERLLRYHPECEKKIGSGINYITVGYHPEYEMSRCLFIVRNDGELMDFSYWKCVKGFIHTKYPLHADTFIFRHFQRRNQNKPWQ